MSHFKKVCLDCKREETDPMAMVCTSCFGLLGFHYSFKDVSWDDRFRHNMWRYWPLLPIDDPNSLVTLDEGATLIAGGCETETNFWQPMLFVNLPQDSCLFRETEVPGPRLLVIRSQAETLESPSPLAQP